MKPTSQNSIQCLTGREQTTLRSIRSSVVTQVNPLLLYCFDSNCIQTTGRSCFTTSKRTEKWAFTCSLLVILPDHAPIEGNLNKEIEAAAEHFGKVKVLVHSLSFYLQQLKAGNLFFCWVRLAATLIYERNATTHQLPTAIGYRHQCQELAEALYLADPNMPNYLQEMIPEQYLAVTETDEATKQSKRNKEVWVKIKLADYRDC